MQTSDYQRYFGGGNSANSHWKEFVFGEAFNIVSTKSGIDKIRLDKEEGAIPYVTRTDVNNGIDSFVGGQEEKYKIDSGNVITIGLDTQTVFYQPKPFYTGQNIQIVSHPMLDRYNASFIIVSIKKLVERFSWGSYGATLSRLRRSRIFLPADEKGQIDFAFMSTYMKKVEKDILDFTLKHFKDKLNVNKCEMGGVKWIKFCLSDIFNIEPGTRLTKANFIDGKRPFIGATDSNNGITAWVDNVNDSLDCDVLGVNYNGSVGETFYHPYECIFSDDVKRLHLKDGKKSKYVMLYLKTQILQQKIKYDYGYKFNAERMRRQYIMLPVDDANQPNWEYMNLQMQNLENRLIYNYIYTKN